MILKKFTKHLCVKMVGQRETLRTLPFPLKILVSSLGMGVVALCTSMPDCKIKQG